MRTAFRGLALAGLVCLLAGQARAQGDTEEVSFPTVDKVLLKGTWYTGKDGRKSPCVMFVHGWGSDRSKSGWDELAKDLQSKGYAVLSFDLRGHGKSVELRDKQIFWLTPQYAQWNSAAMRGRPNPTNLPLRIDYKDFAPGYYMWMINDLAAARRFLDERNDAGACNSGQIFVVAETEGATLAMLWAGSEYLRDAIASDNPLQPPPRHKGGSDIAGMAFLSIEANPLNLYKLMPYGSSRLWAATPTVAGEIIEPLKEKTSMCFLYGKNDKLAARDAAFWYASKFHADKVTDKRDKIKYAVPLETELRGSKLLGQAALKTNQTIVDFIEEIKGRGVGNNWIMRNVSNIDLHPVPTHLIGFTR